MASLPRPSLKHNVAKSREQTEVTVRSGTKFMIPKGLLCAHSAMLKAGLTKNRKLYFPDVSDETFELFLFWLYGQATRAKLYSVLKNQNSDNKADVEIKATLRGTACPMNGAGKVRDPLPLLNMRETRDDAPSAPLWLRELSIELAISTSSSILASTSIATEEFRNRYSNRAFIDLAAFAEDFQFKQLTEDLMTVIVGLHNLDPNNRGMHWTGDDIQRLYRSLSAESPLIRYMVEEMALGSGPALLDNIICGATPKQFFVDMCRVLAVGRHGVRKELYDFCNFHDHSDLAAYRNCRERQAKDGAFYASFLQACIETEIVLHQGLMQSWAGLADIGTKRGAIRMI